MMSIDEHRNRFMKTCETITTIPELVKSLEITASSDDTAVISPMILSLDVVDFVANQLKDVSARDLRRAWFARKSLLMTTSSVDAMRVFLERCIWVCLMRSNTIMPVISRITPLRVLGGEIYGYVQGELNRERIERQFGHVYGGYRNVYIDGLPELQAQLVHRSIKKDDCDEYVFAIIARKKYEAFKDAGAIRVNTTVAKRANMTRYDDVAMKNRIAAVVYATVHPGVTTKETDEKFETMNDVATYFLWYVLSEPLV